MNFFGCIVSTKYAENSLKLKDRDKYRLLIPFRSNTCRIIAYFCFVPCLLHLYLNHSLLIQMEVVGTVPARKEYHYSDLSLTNLCCQLILNVCITASFFLVYSTDGTQFRRSRLLHELVKNILAALHKLHQSLPSKCHSVQWQSSDHDQLVSNQSGI